MLRYVGKRLFVREYDPYTRSFFRFKFLLMGQVPVNYVFHDLAFVFAHHIGAMATYIPLITLCRSVIMIDGRDLKFTLNSKA
jgi:hypothetical protein